MGASHPVILFDGVCNLCNGAVQFIIRRDTKGIFKFAPLQSTYAASLIAGDAKKPDADTIILVDEEGLWYKSTAALRIARKLSGGWPLLYSMMIVPKFLRDVVYDWIARNRYNFFGKRDQCMIPTPDLKARFLS